MAMWVYKQTEGPSAWSAGLWTVGFYDPDDNWQPESDHNSADEAAVRVHWLNGGKDEPVR